MKHHFFQFGFASLWFWSLSPPAWGAWALISNGPCSASSKTSGTTVSCTIGDTTLIAGRVAIIFTAWDNTDTADGQTTRLSISDSRSNSYTKACEYTITNGGAAADGATVAIFFSKLTTDLIINVDTITATSDTARTAKVIVGETFSIASGNTVSLVGTCQTLKNVNSDAGSQTISGLANSEHLFLRAIASETDVCGITTLTANYSLFVSLCTSGAAEASNMGSAGEFRIFTATTDSTDPTMSDTTADRASIYVALDEAAPPPPGGGGEYKRKKIEKLIEVY